MNLYVLFAIFWFILFTFLLIFIFDFLTLILFMNVLFLRCIVEIHLLTYLLTESIVDGEKDKHNG